MIPPSTTPARVGALLICGRSDDDPAVREVMAAMGAHIVRARSRAEALALLQAQDFALVLAGFAGDAEALAATIRQVRGIPRASLTPVIALALPEQAPFSFDPLYEAGALAVLTEPLSPAILRATARFHIGDATRQSEAERQLRLSEERYRTLFDSIDEGVCVIEMLYDSHGRPCDYRFLETNPAFIKHTGLTDAIGRTIREIVPRHEQHWFDIYGRVADTGEPVRFENEARELGRYYDVYAVRIGPAEQRRVAVVFNDIFERRRQEEALRRMALDLAEADRLKTEFLATLAHELRNPLAPIRSGLQFIRRAPGDPAAVARVHDIMERQLGHLVNLVDDLLDVARITRGQIDLRRERIDLATVLQAASETSMPLIEAARHQLELRQAPQPLMVEADLTRLTQVVSNLLNNAARYTPRGGNIVLAAERDGDEALIKVSDNGIGIDPAALDEVFTMFTQVGERREQSAAGLGIGLSLVRSLVELHGGTVSAASAGTNAGSTFTVRLPLAQPGSAAPPAAALRLVASNGRQVEGLKVLVVDDNRDAAETLSALLDHLGHSAPVANDGHQALRMMGLFKPQVLFLDLGMPGMSGYEVAAEIRRNPAFAGVRLVALTGWGGDSDRARTLEAGFDHHLTKPATIEAIEAALGGL